MSLVIAYCDKKNGMYYPQEILLFLLEMQERMLWDLVAKRFSEHTIILRF